MSRYIIIRYQVSSLHQHTLHAVDKSTESEQVLPVGLVSAVEVGDSLH